ncbi:MAG: biotin/lipoyl-binding protein [Burkholderiaceae bacterium]|nr:biotin/lipoyl-binding protein [Burkholderiaceae bacterium]
MSHTFSESWHRVAEARLGLLPTVVVHKQHSRGRDWYVLRDTYNQKFYRLSPQAYAFVSRLTPQRTVEQVWQSCLRDLPAEAPGQEEAMQVLSQLHQANLLYHDTPADSLTIFTRHREHKRRELQGKLLSFLSIRIPLWDPNRWLDRQRGLARALVSWPFAALLALIALAGGVTVVSQAQRLWNQTEGLFAVDNLLWLYAAMALMKALHEYGHALVVKRFGGEVHSVGIMLLLLVPLPYVDATGSWAFRDRHARALVGAAGIIVELALAALGAMVWAATGPGLVNSLAFNVMVIGSVSSLLFNGNPLLRFDAYYVLSDLVDIPNLYQRAGQQWKYFGNRWLLGTQQAESPARDRREWAWLTGYGAASFIYRMLVFVSILLLLADHWFGVAVIFSGVMLFVGVLRPGWQWWTHLRSPALLRNRSRAFAVSAALVLAPLALIFALPLPDALRAPGVVEARQLTRVAAGSPGRLLALEVQHGDRVRAGQVLLRLANAELELEAQAAQSALEEAELLRNLALERAVAEVAVHEQRVAAAAERLAQLRARLAELTVRAAHDGTWVAEGLHERLNNWVGRGQALGELSAPGGLRFSAVVSQEQAQSLFGQRLDGAELRLRGQAGEPVRPTRLVLVPHQSQKLMSSALGWQGGGSVAVRPDDPRGVEAMDPYFELQAQFAAGSGGQADGSQALALHGMTGWLRVPLPPRTAAEQLVRAWRQLLQKRYQL